MGVESPVIFFGLIPLSALILIVIVLRARVVWPLLGSLYDRSRVLKKLFLHRWAAVSCAGVFMITALAGVYYISSDQEAALADLDVSILNDESFSSSAKDEGYELARIEREKIIARNLVLHFRHANMAVCEFTSKVFCRAPFGSPHSAIFRTIDKFEVEAITGSGSELTDALKRIARECPKESKRPCVIFLLSDGGEALTSAYKIDEMDQVLRNLRDRDITVMPIGIGGHEEVYVAKRPAISRYSQYEVIEQDGQLFELLTSRLQEEKLRHIAASTGGVYIHESNLSEASFSEAINASLESAGIMRATTKSLAWVFIAMALASLFVYGLFFLDPS